VPKLGIPFQKSPECVELSGHDIEGLLFKKATITTTATTTHNLQQLRLTKYTTVIDFRCQCFSNHYGIR